ncbi:helix-turn-helix transcriptional regulator [Cryobacterium zhongshanensis]|uniref:WYL domain-containing protein n=1 Tax=Cryobacterium zhongshanensis TaxID=2928153 RepID=A0AA41UF74_9MICO|nr:WYL domain-containing protein [Cryobacterium zhongshanensis]MCI4657710.1 WYL domain-containing protein [Cryobacterium zhongshanensis]
MSPRVPLGAPDKLTFLLSLVPYLIDHDGISVTDVAAHFGVTPERVRDAVTLIAVSGVPGDTSQYLPGDLFDIEWGQFESDDTIVLTHLVAIEDSPRFSAREAAALIAGLQYLSSLPENADRDAIASLMAKLTRSATAAPSQLAVSASASGTAISVIQSALQTGVQVRFDYLNARGGQEERYVDPLRVESVDRDWYLRGWCHLRGAVRTFRLDRMSTLTATDRPVTSRTEDLILPDALFQGSESDLDVVVELAAGALPLLGDYLSGRPVQQLAGDRVRATLRVSHYHALKRLVAGLSGVVTVVEPAAAREIVRAWADAGAARYPEPAASAAAAGPGE